MSPEHSAEYVAPDQGEEPMPEATVTTGFDTRLCALDRAINYAHNCTHGEVLSSDRVLEIAHQFEQYLARTDA